MGRESRVTDAKLAGARHELFKTSRSSEPTAPPERFRAIVEKVVELAVEGDVKAAKLILDYTLPRACLRRFLGRAPRAVTAMVTVKSLRAAGSSADGLRMVKRSRLGPGPGTYSFSFLLRVDARPMAPVA